MGAVTASRLDRLLLVALLATLAVVGVQLADPLRGPPEAPALDYDAPPGELARDALAQAPARDHAVEWRVVDPDDGRSATRVAYRVDADDRQLRAVSHQLDTPYVTFANEHVRWQGFRGELRFEGTGPGWNGTASRFRHVDRLASAPNVSRSANASAVVVRVDDTDTAWALVHGRRNVTDTERASEEAYRANLTVVVDRETDAPRRVVYRFARSPDGNASARERRVAVYAYDRWDDVDATRPPGAGYTLVEFVADLAD